MQRITLVSISSSKASQSFLYSSNNLPIYLTKIPRETHSHPTKKDSDFVFDLSRWTGGRAIIQWLQSHESASLLSAPSSHAFSSKSEHQTTKVPQFEQTLPEISPTLTPTGFQT